MGMFDYVDYKDTICPSCKQEMKTEEELYPFQSKDADCELNIILPEKVKHFYTECPHCFVWVKYKVETVAYKVELDDG